MPSRVVSDDGNEFKTNVIVWSCGAALSLLLLASVLILAPRLLLFFSEDPALPDPRTALSPLEAFLARFLGIWLAAISFALILNIPSYSPPLESSPLGTTPRQPLLGPVTLAANVTGLLAWNTEHVGSLATVMSFILGTIGLWGLWTLVFGDSPYPRRDKSRAQRTS